MDRLRSPLGRAIGLGSAKEGVEHWWAQRGAAVLAWLHAPVQAILAILLLIAVFYHAALGLQVVVEDYVHAEWLKVSSLVTMRLVSFGLAVAGIFAVLRIAFGG